MENISDDALLIAAGNYYKNQYFREAKDLYLEILDRGVSVNKCNYQLANIALKTNNYQEARTILSSQDDNDCSFSDLKIQLELAEYNFSRAEKELYQRIDSCSNHLYLSDSLANLYIQKGEYDTARKIYQTLLLNLKSRFNATKKLILLDILVADYEQAFYHFNMIDSLRLKDLKNLSWYKYVNNILQEHLGMINDPASVMGYRNKIIVQKDQNKELVTSHIEKHLCDSSTDTGFFQFTDLSALYDEVKINLSAINPIFTDGSSKYSLSFSTPIGVVDGQISSDIKAVCVLGEEKIITMYPIILSAEFNQEGYHKNEKIIMKRKNYQK